MDKIKGWENRPQEIKDLEKEIAKTADEFRKQMRDVKKQMFEDLEKA